MATDVCRFTQTNTDNVNSHSLTPVEPLPLTGTVTSASV